MRVNFKKLSHWYKFEWCDFKKKDVPQKYQCELMKKKLELLVKI